MIEDLVEVIDRSWLSLRKRRGSDFALRCFPFHEQLTRDARTALLLEDFRREDRESSEELRAAWDAARREALEMLEELQARQPEAIPAKPDSDKYDRSAEAIRSRLTPKVWQQELEGEDAWSFAQERENDTSVENALGILRALLGETDLKDLQARAEATEARLEYAKRKRRIYYRTSAGASLARVERDLSDLHPPVGEPGSLTDMGRWSRMREKPLGNLVDILFHDKDVIHGNADAGFLNARVDVLRTNMERVYEEVRRRLGAERSLLAVVDRYRQRCQWYDADKLRALAENGVGTPEDRLSETLAIYLFDHGLNPLTRPLLGRLLPDILHTHPRFSFYVEAKQYEQSRRGYLLQGMQQVWDMLDHVRGSGFDIHEAFYVIYRRGGPRYSFPPRVQHRDRVVHIVMVDIAPTSERGSHASRTLAFDTADLLPGVAVPEDEQDDSVADSSGR